MRDGLLAIKLAYIYCVFFQTMITPKWTPYKFLGFSLGAKKPVCSMVRKKKLKGPVKEKGVPAL